MKPSDRRITPPWLLDLVRETFRGPIGLDPFTEPDNPTGAKRFYSLNAPQEWSIAGRATVEGFRGHDGLEAQWLGGVPTWVNPPFSQLLECVKKTVHESLDSVGPAVLVLTPTDASTEYSRLLRTHALMDAQLTKRVKCLDPDDGRVKDVARSATVWLIGDSGWGERFERVFSIAGHWVRKCR